MNSLRHFQIQSCQENWKSWKQKERKKAATKTKVATRDKTKPRRGDASARKATASISSWPSQKSTQDWLASIIGDASAMKATPSICTRSSSRSSLPKTSQFIVLHTGISRYFGFHKQKKIKS